MKNGFSLVELAIVLVILGLLTGGILAGQSLIKAAELRAATAQLTQYRTTLYSFRDKYFQLPGDMNNAHSFWGSNCAASAGLCNGNGDGAYMEIGQENFMGWKHLALAGLIEGSYTGAETGAASSNCVTIGTNVPRSRLNNTGYNFRRYGGTLYGKASTNAFQWGAASSGDCTLLDNPALTPEQAWNVDTKADDGIAVTGKIFGLDTAATCISGAAYNLSSTTTACRLWFWLD